MKSNLVGRLGGIVKPEVEKQVEKIEDAEDLYNPNACPPNFTLAKNHGISQGIYMELKDRKHDQKKECPCCGLAYDLKPVPLCGNLDELYKFGSGYALYFLFIKCCIIMLLVILGMSGVYNMVSNVEAEDCDSVDVPGGQFCKQSFISNFALASKRDEDNFIRIQLILNLVTVLCIMMLFHFIRYQCRKMSIKADDKTMTPSDYTLRINGIPGIIEDDAVKAWVEGINPKVKVVKINRGYAIREYINMIKKRSQLEVKKDAEKDAEKAENMKKLIGELDENSKKELQKVKKTNISFVTIETAQGAHFMTDFFKKSLVGRIIDLLTPSLLSKTRFKGKRVVVERAPEPTDVIWTNLDFELKDKIKSRAITFFASFIFVAIGFGLIVLLNWLQFVVADNQGEEESKALSQGLSIIASLLIFVINFVLAMLIRWLAGYEKHSTYTNFFKGVASKLTWAQFVNTAFTTLLAKLLIFAGEAGSGNITNGLKDMRFYSVGGLIQNMFYVFIINAFLAPILLVINPGYLFKIFSRNKEAKKGTLSKKTQSAANAMYEGPVVDMAQKYAGLIKTLLLTCFYAPPIPFSLIFQIVGLVLLFWAEKFTFLRVNKRPNAMGDELTFEMIEQLEWTAFLFAAGNLLFTYVLERSNFERSYIDYGLVWATIGVSLFHIIAPMELVNEKLFPLKDDVTESLTYKEAIRFFDTDYDVENPITRKKAKKEFKKMKKEALKAAATKEKAKGTSQNQLQPNPPQPNQTETAEKQPLIQISPQDINLAIFNKTHENEKKKEEQNHLLGVPTNEMPHESIEQNGNVQSDSDDSSDDDEDDYFRNFAKNTSNNLQMDDLISGKAHAAKSKTAATQKATTKANLKENTSNIKDTSNIIAEKSKTEPLPLDLKNIISIGSPTNPPAEIKIDDSDGNIATSFIYDYVANTKLDVYTTSSKCMQDIKDKHQKIQETQREKSKAPDTENQKEEVHADNINILVEDTPHFQGQVNIKDKLISASKKVNEGAPEDAEEVPKIEEKQEGITNESGICCGPNLATTPRKEHE